jgi:uncharacterized protein YndB with AHSA1/START domain
MSAERRIEVEVEVPATPEEAWEAIATGPGISAWFMPAAVEGRVGGSVVHRHEAGMETTGEVTSYEPPHRFAYEEAGWMPEGEHAKRLTATEFLVEARSGGTCVVRLVMSGFGEGETWDRAIESFTSGWNQALLALRLYLTHFPGQEASSINAGEVAGGDPDAIWAGLTSALGVPAEPSAGSRVTTGGSETPPLSGTVEKAGGRMITLVLDEPAPGIGFVGAGGPGEQVFVFVRAQLFGSDAQEVAARQQAAWRDWFAHRGATASPRG